MTQKDDVASKIKSQVSVFSKVSSKIAPSLTSMRSKHENNLLGEITFYLKELQETDKYAYEQLQLCLKFIQNNQIDHRKFVTLANGTQQFKD